MIGLFVETQDFASLPSRFGVVASLRGTEILHLYGTVTDSEKLRDSRPTTPGDEVDLVDGE